MTPNPDNLRLLYREAASIFLSSYQGSNDDTTETARSLILNSFYYNLPPTNSIDYNNTRKCIVSSNNYMGDIVSTHNATVNSATAISPDNEEKEFQVLEQKFELLKECNEDKTSIERKVEICQSLMDLNSKLENQRNRIMSDFYCVACGSPYLTMGNDVENECTKIRLKRLKRGRTRRRRASRKVAAKITFDNEILQKHKGGGQSFSKSISTSSTNVFSHGAAVASVMDTRIALKNTQAMRSTRDGTAKHAISYKCSCGHEQLFKGFRCRVGNRNNASTDHHMTTSIASGEEKIKKRKFVGKSQKPDLTSPDDYISLRPTMKSLPNSKKQKNTKNKKGTKSKLQDFLSSLND